MPSSQPENQLDNDKAELKTGLMKCVSVDLTHIVPNESTFYISKLQDFIDQYTQSKLKAFAGEFEKAIGKDDRDYSQDNTDLASKIALVASSAACNELRVELRQALKAIKERWNLNG